MSYCYWPQVGQMPCIACNRCRNGQFEYFTDCLDIRYGCKIAGSVLLYSIIVVVVVVLFYVHGKHLRPCRDGQLTYPHFSWTGIDQYVVHILSRVTDNCPS